MRSYGGGNFKDNDKKYQRVGSECWGYFSGRGHDEGLLKDGDRMRRVENRNQKC